MRCVRRAPVKTPGRWAAHRLKRVPIALAERRRASLLGAPRQSTRRPVRLDHAAAVLHRPLNLVQTGVNRGMHEALFTDALWYDVVA